MMFPHDFNMFLDGAWSVFNVVLFIAIVINIVLFVKKINRMNTVSYTHLTLPTKA